MHYVARGRPPKTLKGVRDKYTPPWVAHYKHNIGLTPTDSKWLAFRVELGKRFSGYCGYCETACKGEVDHFRPKSRFPDLVYEWTNWVFSCHDCNNFKVERWPPSGYIDPCAKTLTARPEQFFDFDCKTGEILPKVGLPHSRWTKAKRMIDDLHLNDVDPLRIRLVYLTLISQVLEGESQADPGHKAFVQAIFARAMPFSSLSIAFLLQRGYAPDGTLKRASARQRRKSQ